MAMLLHNTCRIRSTEFEITKEEGESNTTNLEQYEVITCFALLKLQFLAAANY
jgi:hypothetical protein